MESEKSGFTNKMSEIWRKMQVKKLFCILQRLANETYENFF